MPVSEKIQAALMLAAAVLLVALCIFYQSLDRKRFRIERQLRPALPLFNDWAEQCAALEGGEPLYRAYRAAKKPAAKYEALAAMARLARGRQTQSMLRAAGELTAFFSVYNSLVKPYNKQLSRPVASRVGRFIGFRPLPEFVLAESNEEPVDVFPE